MSSALNALFDSPLSHPLVLACGGGNDGVGAVFAGDVAELRLTPLGAVEADVAGHWEVLGATRFPELRGDAAGLEAYATLGAAVDAWVPALREALRGEGPDDASTDDFMRRVAAHRWVRGRRGAERDVAASLQRAYEAELFAILDAHVLRGAPDAFDGLVVSGACAGNAAANAALEARYRLRVHVPPNSDGGGVAVGAAFHVAPPRKRWPLQHAGPRLLDVDTLPSLTADRCPEPAAPGRVAEALAEGLVVAVARSRSEVGPRPLGRRARLAVDCLAFADDEAPWSEQCGSLVLLEDVLAVFGHVVWSPYGTSAPDYVGDAAQGAERKSRRRVQVVTRDDDPWLHALLRAVRARTGVGALASAPLVARRGGPRLNTATACFDVLDVLDGPAAAAPDAPVVDDALVLRTTRCRQGRRRLEVLAYTRARDVLGGGGARQPEASRGWAQPSKTVALPTVVILAPSRSRPRRRAPDSTFSVNPAW